MSSPGQKRRTCGHVMASFDGHFKCARCRDKGVGEDACVLKKDCTVCKGFTPEHILQLATPTYRERKSKEKKLVLSSPAPTLVLIHPIQWTIALLVGVTGPAKVAHRRCWSR